MVGAWFTPPIDFDEVKERIGLNDEYEEYAIHDYELPFEDVYKRQAQRLPLINHRQKGILRKAE